MSTDSMTSGFFFYFIDSVSLTTDNGLFDYDHLYFSHILNNFDK